MDDSPRSGYMGSSFDLKKDNSYNWKVASKRKQLAKRLIPFLFKNASRNKRMKINGCRTNIHRFEMFNTNFNIERKSNVSDSFIVPSLSLSM